MLALLRNMCFFDLLNHALHLPRPLCVGVCTNSRLKKKNTYSLSLTCQHIESTCSFVPLVTTGKLW